MRSDGLFRTAGVALLLALSPTLHAEKADRSKPMDIEADRVTADDVNGTSRYEGNVVITQGSLRLRADRIDVKQDAAGNMTAVAVGKQVTFRQKREGLDEYIDAQSDKLEYDSGNDLVKLTGGARIRRGQDELRGAVIVYHSNTEQYSIEGGAKSADNPQSGRVRVVIQPKTKTPAAAPAGQPVPLKPADNIAEPRPE